MSYLLSDSAKENFGERVSSEKYFIEGASSKLLSLFDDIREIRNDTTFEELLNKKPLFRKGVIDLLAPEYSKPHVLFNPEFKSLLSTVLAGLYNNYISKVKEAEFRKEHGGKSVMEVCF